MHGMSILSTQAISCASSSRVEYGVGVISSGSTDIRVAFSCLEEGQVEEVFDTLLEAWTDLAG